MQTLVTSNSIGILEKDGEQYAVRKLTPRECWRLMGFTDEDFDKASAVCSNNQLYKQSGNSIVVNVLEEVFKQLLLPKTATQNCDDTVPQRYRKQRLF